jgi:hypothetical protein
MSSIPIQDKKASIGLQIFAIDAAIGSNSHTPRLAMSSASRFTQSFIPDQFRDILEQKERRDLEVTPFQFLLSTLRIAN